MQTFLQSFKNSWLGLLFPQICLHCQKALPEQETLLCATCFAKLQFLDPTSRCQGCFAPSEEPLCADCSPNTFSASCFAYEEVAKSLIIAYKFGGRPDLAKGLASFMLLQFVRLSWPLPDLITFIPQSFLRSKLRGYNQSELLANELGHLLGRPVVALLKKPHFTISQTQLEVLERQGLAHDTFILHKAPLLENQELLLIDDVFTTGATIDLAAKVLLKAEAKKVYALTFARAES